MPSTDLNKTLSSNKVNYLIWRYLQESGFSKAAVELQRAWNPNPQDTLPFAGHVDKEWLKGILGLGIEYDEAHERVSKGKCPRRFEFGSDDGPQYSRKSGGFDEEDLFDAVPLPFGTDLHPPGSHLSAIRHISAHDAESYVPPEMATKPKSTSRRRKGTASKEQRPNDVMDVDSNGMLHLSTAVGDGVPSELASPAVEDTEPLPQSTADVGDEKHTQSERVQQIVPDVATFEARPSISPSASVHSSIEHASFAPGELNTHALLLAGSNLARIYVVPEGSLAEPAFDHTSSINIDFQAPNLLSFNVLAFTWTPDCGTAVMAVWETYTNEQGEKLSQGNLIRLIPGSDNEMFVKESLDRTIRDVVALKWNKASRSILCLSITGKSTWIRIWQASSNKNQTLIAVPPKKEAEKRYFDAEWIGDTRFVLCGEDCITVYEITSSPEIVVVESISSSPIHWHLIKFDGVSKTVAAVSKDTPDISIFEPRITDNAESTGTTQDLSTHRLISHATDLAFHTLQGSAGLGEEEPRLLAVSCENGQIIVFNIRRSWEQLAQLALGMQKSAEVCSWSNDGSFLAAAGAGRVVTWSKEDIMQQGSQGGAVLPRAVWVASESQWHVDRTRSKPLANGHATKHTSKTAAGLPGDSSTLNGEALTNGVQNGIAAMDIDGDSNGITNTDNESEVSDEVDLRQQKLVWDADGKTLVYTMGDQVAVIRYR